jgi:hypothetical protein
MADSNTSPTQQSAEAAANMAAGAPTSTTSSPGPGAQSPQAMPNQLPQLPATQAAVEAAMNNGGRK